MSFDLLSYVAGLVTYAAIVDILTTSRRWRYRRRPKRRTN